MVSRSPGFIKGYAEIVKDELGTKVEDATPAIIITLILFLMPAEPNFLRLEPSPPLIDWHTAESKLPWGIILLLGEYNFRKPLISRVKGSLVRTLSGSQQLKQPCHSATDMLSAVGGGRKSSTFQAEALLLLKAVTCLAFLPGSVISWLPSGLNRS